MLDRALGPTLAARLAKFPVVVVTGARQTGKTTLARHVGGARRYLSLGDLGVLDRLERGPGFFREREPLLLDEVHRRPAVLDRVLAEAPAPGRFLLVASANLPPDPLPEAASRLTLWPMTRGELAGLGETGGWEALLAAPHSDWIEVLDARGGQAEDWRTLARRGGLPEPAVNREEAARSRWFDGYVRDWLDRDLRSYSRITALPDLWAVMRAAARRLGGLANQAELGREADLPQQTVGRYLDVLETAHLMVRLPAWKTSRARRLITTPKLYWPDTGLALHLAGGPPGPAHLENLVLHDLLAWRDARDPRVGLHYWRAAAGAEVDFVVEDRGRLLPIEVKATSNPGPRAARHLLTFLADYDNAPAGLLLHAGDQTCWLTPRVLSAPWWRVL